MTIFDHGPGVLYCACGHVCARCSMFINFSHARLALHGIFGGLGDSGLLKYRKWSYMDDIALKITDTPVGSINMTRWIISTDGLEFSRTAPAAPANVK